MDLLATVRKEGSRGGRGDFKWSDVQTSSHRENYLGHSLMAPVGRWAKGRDLNWYAKGDRDADAGAGEDPAAKAARERKEEIQRVKAAEEDALARALGLPVAPRDNPNMEELGGQRKVGRVLQEAADENDAAASRGVGYGRLAGISKPETGTPSTERIEGTSNPLDNELQYALKEYRRRHGDRHTSRSRSRDRDRDREHKKKRSHGDRQSDRHTERHKDLRSGRRSFSNERLQRRLKSPSDDRTRVSQHRERQRSRSPHDRYHRDKRDHYDDRRRRERRREYSDSFR